jgi:adenylate cyclase class IV
MKLIWYNRAQVAGPKKSDIIIVNVSTVPELHALLATMLGVKNHVEKRRELYLIGRTRIHLDTLSDGRQFIEVEVVMRRREDPRSASKEAEEIKARLGIKDTDLIVGSYADMFTFTSTTTTTTH